VLAGDLDKNPYTFTGKRFDSESELYHFHFRQYDAMVGVWTTPDPIGILGGINLYSYVENNPVNLVDVFGLHSGGDNGPGGDPEGNEMPDGSTVGDMGQSDSDGGGFWESLWAGVIDWQKLAKYNNPVKLTYKSTLQRAMNFLDELFETVIAPSAGIPTSVKGLSGAIGVAMGEMFNPPEAGTPTLEDAGISISDSQDNDGCDH